jgi:hypothetical protein
MQACDHAFQCTGFDACSKIPLDCSVPQQECIAQCVLPIDCAQFGLQAFAGCQAQCQGDAGDGGAGSCQLCSATKCTAQVGACAQDMAAGGCAAWLKCVGVCYGANPVDPACFSACDAQYPNAATEYHAVYNCACVSCNAECAGTGACNLPDGGQEAGPDAPPDAPAP